MGVHVWFLNSILIGQAHVVCSKICISTSRGTSSSSSMCSMRSTATNSTTNCFKLIFLILAQMLLFIIGLLWYSWTLQPCLNFHLVLQNLIHQLSFPRMQLLVYHIVMAVMVVVIVVVGLIHDVEVESFLHFVRCRIYSVLRTSLNSHLFRSFVCCWLLPTCAPDAENIWVLGIGCCCWRVVRAVWVLSMMLWRFLALTDQVRVFRGLVFWRFWNFGWNWMLCCYFSKGLVYVTHDVQI